MRNYYHVKTQEAYDNLMAFLEEQGYVWATGLEPTKTDLWKWHKEKTVIEVNKANRELSIISAPFLEHILGITDFIEWTATSPKKSIEVSKEFDEWVQKNKKAHVDYKSWCIWQINMMGYGHWLEDPITEETLYIEEGFDWTKEVKENKELHTRAILDGYTVKKEPMYEIPLSCLKTTDGEVQYLSYKDKTWFASRKHTWLKQRFTETELKEEVPGFYRELAVKVDE
ncbi:TPA: DUF1642 domain-containing protein [Enterococcus faecalis]|uniref:DUF1642 domain-containing protein n=3 Tax=Enterococcus faecalis TaxID=1351 RepID=UPI0018E7DB4D|nr:DUF1642 domain-containing protein [Enterococcus faecalis]EKY7969742.1 DUF1642 domain-containing protein [Enterococcus faecalis]MBJ0343139.1 DUF1642 domain-containing protein [Enterococcus faecalis]MBJ0389615.1 DUF1642 domain-containing protein [Enterococcus faecalis]MBJ0403582.1 DUF1642 domain-containing protein [Enterococcus faecalis]MBJ0476666.1 DUF1642 domain-containing protein [Enterococcus faecalis]